jgi:uncharacterized protein YegL
MRSLKNLQPKNWNIPLNKKQYDAEINRKNPSAIMIMIDQSGSMGFAKQKYKGEMQSYAEIVSDMINGLLNELIGRCTKSEGVRDYFNVCVLGYGGQSGTKANILWEGNLLGKDWVSISELKANASYEEKTIIRTIRGVNKPATIEVPYWFKPLAKHQTPMGSAFDKAHKLLGNWIQKHEDSYPPVLINITDGVQTDCDDDTLVESAQKVQALNTKDGHALVLNCHISDEDERQVIFPLSDSELPDNEYSQRLYEMSSVMPASFNVDIARLRNDADTFINYRGMSFNTSVDALLNFIDIGTSGSTQRLSGV